MIHTPMLQSQRDLLRHTWENSQDQHSNLRLRIWFSHSLALCLGLVTSLSELQLLKHVSHSCVRLFMTPWTVPPPGFSVHGILQTRILEWAGIPFSRGSSRPRDGTRVSCIVGGLSEPPGKPRIHTYIPSSLDFLPIC